MSFRNVGAIGGLANTLATPLSFPANSVWTGAASATNTTGLITRTNVADGASSIGTEFDNSTLLTTGGSNYIAFAGGGTIYGYITAYTGGNSGLRLSAAGGGGVNEYMSIDGPITGFQWVVGASSRLFLDSTHLYTSSTANIGDSVNFFGQIWGGRFNGLSQSVAFSATPNFDATANGELIHFGPVTGNVTGATFTSGTRGQRCTVHFLKDGTAGTYTIAFAGTNVRAAAGIAFTAAASSILSVSFRWNDKLGTPAWVQDGPALAAL